jgi:transcriptional regulator with XRE-family HTH domain
METLAKRLRFHRKRCGMTGAQVARRLGIPDTTYREWEYGRAIQGEPYQKLAEIFDIRVLELLIGPQADREQLVKDVEQAEGILRKLKQLL